MSQSSRGAQWALFRCHNITISRQTLRPSALTITATTPRRTFSTSPSHKKHGPLATFPETSLPPLNDLLSTIRSTIFLPSHLLAPQKSLVYRNRHAASLPIEIDLSPSQSVSISHINRLTDEPSMKKSIPQILNLLKTSTERRDWDFLPAFLQEMHIARRKLAPERWERIARVANEKGRSDILIEACKRGAGVELGNVRVGREMMWGPLLLALQAGWTRAVVDRALKQAEDLVDLLAADEKEDRKRTGVSGFEGEPHISDRPDFVAIPLALASLSALKHADSPTAATSAPEPSSTTADVEPSQPERLQKVGIYTRRLIATYPALSSSLSPLPSATSSETPTAARAQKEARNTANYRLQLLCPLLFAMRNALTVLSTPSNEQDTAKEVVWLKEKIPDVQSIIDEARSSLLTAHDGSAGKEAAKRRGMVWYDSLAGGGEV